MLPVPNLSSIEVAQHEANSWQRGVSPNSRLSPPPCCCAAPLPGLTELPWPYCIPWDSGAGCRGDAGSPCVGWLLSALKLSATVLKVLPFLGYATAPSWILLHALGHAMAPSLAQCSVFSCYLKGTPKGSSHLILGSAQQDGCPFPPQAERRKLSVCRSNRPGMDGLPDIFGGDGCRACPSSPTTGSSLGPGPAQAFGENARPHEFAVLPPLEQELGAMPPQQFASATTCRARSERSGRGAWKPSCSWHRSQLHHGH